MAFNYEQSLWGRGKATLAWSDPASFRLQQALSMLQPLSAGARVLEIGCGAGQFIRAIQEERSDFVCFGCDISVTALESARQHHDRVEYTVCSATALPHADASLDAVVIFDVLEHVENVTATIAETKRVLKPGGLAYCFVPCEDDILSLWHLLDKIHLKRALTKKYAGHINYFSRRSLLALFQPHFSIVSLHYSEHFLGQILGVAAFFLMDRAAKQQGLQQINNETYFNQKSSGLVKLIKKAVNSLIYLESTWLQRVPSPNVHLVARKKL